MRRTNGGKFSNSFDSSFIDEFNALESALNAEIDSLSPRSPLSHQSSTRVRAISRIALNFLFEIFITDEDLFSYFQIPNSSELTSRVLQSHSTAFADVCFLSNFSFSFLFKSSTDCIGQFSIFLAQQFGLGKAR